MLKTLSTTLLVAGLFIPSLCVSAEHNINVLALHEFPSTCKKPDAKELIGTQELHIKNNKTAADIISSSSLGGITTYQQKMDSALQYFKQEGIPTLNAKIIGSIPYYVRNTANKSVSYSELHNAIENDAYIKKYMQLLNADIVWLKTRCQNADQASQTAYASTPAILGHAPDSKPLIMISQSKAKANVVAQQLGHLFTLKHDVPSWYKTDLLAPLLPSSGVGVIYTTQQGKPSASIMAYCPKDSACYTLKKRFSDGSPIPYQAQDAAQFPDAFYLFKDIDFEGMGDAEKANIKANILRKEYRPNSVGVLAREIPKVAQWSDTSVPPIGYNHPHKAENQSYIGTIYNDSIDISNNENAKRVYLSSGIDKIVVDEQQQITLEPKLFLPSAITTHSGKKQVNHTLIYIKDKKEYDHQTLLRNILDLGNADYCALLPKTVIDRKAEIVRKIDLLEQKNRKDTAKYQDALAENKKSMIEHWGRIIEKNQAKIKKHEMEANFYKTLDPRLCSEKETGSNPHNSMLEIFIRDQNLMLRVDLPFMMYNSKVGGNEHTADASVISLLINGPYNSYTEYVGAHN